MKDLSDKIKKYRTRKGFSQEELAEKSGLSLRTVQRIENGETIPRGDSLQRLTSALGVTPDDIMDWEVIEDKSYLLGLNLSALFFLIFPLLGVFVPLIIWLSRKDRVQEANELAKKLLNFQLTWVIILFGGFLVYILLMVMSFNKVADTGDVSPILLAGSMKLAISYLEIYLVVTYLYNVILILINTRRISKGKAVKYIPSIRFMRTA